MLSYQFKGLFDRLTLLQKILQVRGILLVSITHMHHYYEKLCTEACGLRWQKSLCAETICLRKYSESCMWAHPSSTQLQPTRQTSYTPWSSHSWHPPYHPPPCLMLQSFLMDELGILGSSLPIGLYSSCKSWTWPYLNNQFNYNWMNLCYIP